MKTAVIATCLSIASALGAVGEETLSFSRDIHPILPDKCFGCHGPSAKGSEGQVATRCARWSSGGPDAEVRWVHCEGGQSGRKRIVAAGTTDDPDDVMPPEESHKPRLNEENLPRSSSGFWTAGEYEPFWSFIPPQHRPPAVLQNGAWGGGYIDNRVMARLESVGLQPKAEADKRTLLRRVTFDLTGLPPTLAEIDAFLKDDSPDAYEKVVDGLLAQGAYGEHMARYWADLVRLADTNGMHKDFPRDFSTYRTG